MIDIRQGNGRPVPTATSLVPFDFFGPGPKPESLQRLARWVLDHGMESHGEYRAARDLLGRQSPRFAGSDGPGLLASGETTEAAARRIAPSLDESYLAIQGPPGSGKSTVGAEMIVDLVERGKRVGVTANSHKVIGELLAKAAEAAEKRGVPVRIGQRSSSEPTFGDAIVLKDNPAALDALEGSSVDVVGGTTWLWAREEMTGTVDVLFIDEAGQMSLADAVAASPCAASLVLLGDPQQLDQPLQGTHPPGAERSVLAHLLDGERVMPDDLGLFLDGSWRLPRRYPPTPPRSSTKVGSMPTGDGSCSISPACPRCREPGSGSFRWPTAGSPANLPRRRAGWPESSRIFSVRLRPTPMPRAWSMSSPDPTSSS